MWGNSVFLGHQPRSPSEGGPSEDTLTWWGDYPQEAQVEESVCVYFSFVWFVYVPMCPPPGPTQYIFHTPMTRYSLFVLKVSLNTNKTNKQNKSQGGRGLIIPIIFVRT